jgi:diguanylate cyclase (GGDEF)-like protein
MKDKFRGCGFVYKNFRFNIALLVVFITLFFSYNLFNFQREVTETQYEELINDLSQVSNNFSVWISDKKKHIETSKDIIDNFSYDDITKTSIHNQLLKINIDNEDVSEIYIGLADGGFVTGSDWVPPSDYDPRTRVWYQEAIEQNQTIVSKVYVDRETLDQTITISSPLYINDELIGVMSVDVFLSNIQQYLKSQIEDENVYAYLLDYEGLLIAHTSREYLISTNLYTDIKDEVIISYVDEAKLTNKQIRMEYEFENQSIRGIIQNIDGTNWYLAVASERGNISNSADLIRSETLIVNVFLIVIILALILMMLRTKNELDKLNKILKKDSERDFLTGLYNRRYLNLYVKDLWSKISLDRNISLLMIDIDYFKNYNDTYGHLMGDDVIKEVSNAIHDNIRKDDILSRFGGEEFLLLLEGVSASKVQDIALKIKKSVSDLNIKNEASSFGFVTISIGVVNVTVGDGYGVKEALDFADKALYKAKSLGRNKVYTHIIEE